MNEQTITDDTNAAIRPPPLAEHDTQGTFRPPVSSLRAVRSSCARSTA